MDVITLDEVNFILVQQFGESAGEVGVVISGDFDFASIREFLEEGDEERGIPGKDESEYRGFEVWGDNNEIALLEDRGLIAISPGFVEEFLKALDRGGFVDDESEMKRALDRVGDVLVYYGRSDCERGYFFPTSEIARCEALVAAVEGGGVFEEKISGVYVFRNEDNAERGRDDVEDAIEDGTFDADPDEVEYNGEFVIYKATIHREYKYETPTPTPEATRDPTPTPEATRDPRATRAAPRSTPTSRPAGREQSPFEIAMELLNCGFDNDHDEVIRLLRNYDFDFVRAGESIVEANSVKVLMEFRDEVCR